MSLRIRRGLNSQRSSVVLDTGEIAWATDTKKLYVGDGSTSGGVHVLATSVDETSGLIWDNTTQKIRYTGVLENALQNLVEDTSPELGGDLNLNNRTINGTGTINFTGGISASTLSLATGLSANLPLNGRSITGAGGINITGTTAATTVNANNINVFAQRVSGGLVIETNSSNLDAGFDLLTVNAFYNASTFPASMVMSRARGTQASPDAVQAGDVLGAFTFFAQTDAETTTPSAIILTSAVAPVTPGPDGIVPGQFTFRAADSNGDLTTLLTMDAAGGVRTAKSITPGIYATESARNAAITAPTAGMIVFITATQKFVGYVTDTGLASGGAPNTTPGWVNLN